MILNITGLPTVAPQHHSRYRPGVIPRQSGRGVLNAVVGIDLGTSVSAAGVIERGEARIVETADGITTISCVAFTKDRVLIGSEAKRQLDENPENTYTSVKRLIGTPFDALSAELQYASYAAQPASDGSTLLSCPARQACYTPQDISSHIVRHLVSHAQAAAGEAISAGVITVPVHFSDRQRAATAAAGASAGLQSLRLLHEPVAAVMAYGRGKATEDSLVLVVDLGGGTYDVSLVECFEGCLEVIATAGDARLGGDDWDRCFMDWALVHKAHRTARQADALDMLRLLEAVRSAKQELSEREGTSMCVPAFQGRDLVMSVTRTEFEQATAPLLRRLWPPLRELGQQACVAWAASPDDSAHQKQAAISSNASSAAAGAAAERFLPQPRRVNRVVLVGGGTLMPSVQDFVSRLTGTPLEVTVDPTLCVALGATVYGGILEGSISGGVELADGAYTTALHDRHSGFGSPHDTS